MAFMIKPIFGLIFTSELITVLILSTSSTYKIKFNKFTFLKKHILYIYVLCIRLTFMYWRRLPFLSVYTKNILIVLKRPISPSSLKIKRKLKILKWEKKKKI